MRFISTRNPAHSATFSQALMAGLTPEGGLYVPEKLLPLAMRPDSQLSIADFATQLLSPFFFGDVLSKSLPEICAKTYNFPIPLNKIGDYYRLELYHGPTLAFKDVGARFLAECLSFLLPQKQKRIVVATSGDTGGAVAGAFTGRPLSEVLILYPKGKISSRQEQQLCAWGDNIRAFAVSGDFDDCQRIVKTVLARPELGLMSANSISIARLLPQMVYHAWASARYHGLTGREASMIVPTGNLGNAMAAIWAKHLGFPISKVILSTNENTAISEYFNTGKYEPQSTQFTLANAMDVGNPSNMERLRNLYPSVKSMTADVAYVRVTDQEIEQTIRTHRDNPVCPHTATALRAKELLGLSDAIVVATADPAKFETIVEPLVGRKLEVAPQLQILLDRPARRTDIDSQVESFLKQL